MAGACGREDGDCCSGSGDCSSGGCQVSSSSPLGMTAGRQCIKCKVAPAIAMANQTEPVCAPCLYSGVTWKFKTVLNNHAVVTAKDKLLVAFSGGAGSRVALNLALELRNQALASRSINAATFQVGVVFVDEGLALKVSSEERKLAVEQIRAVVSELGVPFHCVTIEDVYHDVGDDHVYREDGSDDGNVAKFTTLMRSIKDQTGKEDMLELLRMRLLENVAREHGYTKVVLGSCATRVAARVFSGVAKGQGYSLAASVNYVDARWYAPVVTPLRDCASKDVALICHYQNLDTVFVKNFSTMAVDNSINTLCNAFVSTLKEDNPARDHTIVRTAAKLTPFSFNQLVASVEPGRSRRNLQRGSISVVPEGNNPRESLCGICRSPLKEGDFSSARCFDCNAQRFDEKLLPMPRASMRAQVQEFLLHDKLN